MLNEHKKLLQKALEFITIGQQQASLVLESQPDDTKALDASLRLIEQQCAFIRQFANAPRSQTSITRLHNEEVG